MEHNVLLVQVGWPKRRVYIKFQDVACLEDILFRTRDQLEYKHHNGQISEVRITAAGLGVRMVPIVNLPPEVPDADTHTVMSRYVLFREIQAKIGQRYSDIRWLTERVLVANTLKQRVTSPFKITAYRLLFCYDGQPLTSYGCNDKGHLIQACPLRQHQRLATVKEALQSWADIAAEAPADILMVVPEDVVGTQALPVRLSIRGMH